MNRLVPQLGPPPCGFSQLLSSTRRGARLARLLAVSALQSWGAPQDLTERAELVVAELAANAVAHGYAPGRDFRLALHFEPAAGLVRVEVTDALGERLPRFPRPLPEGGPSDALRTGGYGLMLVAALADHWETIPHPPGGKTVRVVLTTPPPGDRRT
ncbi:MULTISPECIES: ATP-binding protein [unclassified Streptomyces]|uniref:ATP-binding protein n=1 Tax=unclassified Streptomyces TaxID=2593676 RepID=UPI001E454E08|nr:ATP-binding protein [Streptomyces sp. CB02980]MCB8905784.1 ATP-binding protein [Streptomyces sp. CB02980]